MLLIFLIRYDFNDYAVPYASTCTTEAPGHLLRPPLAYPDLAGSGAPAPSLRSGEQRSTLIGGAARATRGCLAPRTLKYPDAVSLDFRTTPWLVLARYYVYDSYHHSRSRVSRYLVRSNFVRVRERSPKNCGRGGETFAIAVIKCGFSERSGD